MPRKDGTGPEGKGPMSGRGAGKCAVNRPSAAGGRGLGRGQGQGQGQGRRSTSGTQQRGNRGR